MARQVDVSHNAAYRHFASREALLTRWQEVGLGGLGATMKGGAGRRPLPAGPAERARQRLRAIGGPMCRTPWPEPGCSGPSGPRPSTLALRQPVSSDDVAQAEMSDPYGYSISVLDELVDAGAIPASTVPTARRSPGSAVHGLAMLIINGPPPACPCRDRPRAEPTCDVIDAGL